jgi:hypothetical protein
VEAVRECLLVLAVGACTRSREILLRFCHAYDPLMAAEVLTSVSRTRCQHKSDSCSRDARPEVGEAMAFRS